MNLFKNKKGYTLIELLVVIGILAVIAGITIPVVAGLTTTARLKGDNQNAEAMTTAISLWMTEDPSDSLIYKDQLDLMGTSVVSGPHRGAYEYTIAYMGTEQLPGTEFLDATTIRNAAVIAIASLTKEEVLIKGNSFYLNPPQTSGYGYKYYYRAGVVTVEELNSTYNLKTGAEYEGYVWLNETTTADKLFSDIIDKREKNTIAPDTSNLKNHTFAFKFAVDESPENCSFEISNDNCSYTLSGNLETPKTFTIGEYNIKFLHNGDIKIENKIEVRESDCVDGVVTVSFGNGSGNIYLSSPISDFIIDFSGGKYCISQYIGSETGTIIVPAYTEDGYPIKEISATGVQPVFGTQCLAKKIIVPSTVERVYPNSFYACPNLTYLSLPSPTLDRDSISSCSKLSKIDFTTLSLPTNAQRQIKNEAIRNCSSLTNLILPFPYTQIDQNAFETLQIPNTNLNVLVYKTPEEINVTKSYVKYHYPSQQYFDTSSLSTQKIALVPSRIAGNVSLSTFNIPSSFKSPSGVSMSFKTIASESFYSVSEKNYFDALTNIQSINIDEGYETIEDGAFRAMPITSVTLPYSLKTVGKNAFDGNKCKSLIIPKNIESIGANAFTSQTLQTVTIECDVLEAFTDASGNPVKVFSGCTRLKTIVIKNFNGSEQDKAKINAEFFYLQENLGLDIIFM